MAVIGEYDIAQQPVAEEESARHALPSCAGEATFLRRFQDCVLCRRVEAMEWLLMRLARFLVDGAEAAPPRLAQRRQCSVTITIAVVLLEFVVDEGGDRDGGPVGGLRHDPRRDRDQRAEFVLAEEARLTRQRQPGIDNAARLLVPGRCVALRQYVVAGIALSHRHAPP